VSKTNRCIVCNDYALPTAAVCEWHLNNPSNTSKPLTDEEFVDEILATFEFKSMSFHADGLSALPERNRAVLAILNRIQKARKDEAILWNANWDNSHWKMRRLAELNKEKGSE